MESRPWLKHYEEGIPANIKSDKYPNMVHFIDSVFQSFGSKSAFSCLGKTLTYKKLDSLSDLFGAYLQARGLKPGDRFAIMLPNLLQYPIVTLGAIKAGLVIVNTNPLYTQRELEHQLKDSGAKGIIILENFAATLEQVLPKTNLDVVITATVGDMLGSLKGGMINFVLKNIKRDIPKFNIPNSATFKEALSGGKKFKIVRHQADLEDVLLLQYTGGTTGVSKGAMLTHHNVIANIAQMNAAWTNQVVPGTETLLTALPMYHVFAFTVNMLAFMSAGGHNILIPNARKIETVVKAFKSYPVSLFTGVNTLFKAMMLNKDFDTIDFSHAKFVAAGGMALQKAVADEWKERTGTTILEGYGLTESAPVVSFNPIDGRDRIGSIGVPVSSTDVKIVDEEGNEMPINEPGELCVKGPQIMKGYYNRPEETAKALKDGWLYTGDIGKMDQDGFFYIVDRKKDMILVSGFNVYPNEIEDCIMKHPKVLEVAAVGTPNEKSGEVVKVFVVKKDKSLKEAELIEYCRLNMTGYKVPKEVVFRKELPKTPVGKILRRALKEES